MFNTSVRILDWYWNSVELKNIIMRWNKNVTINKMGKHICGILGCYSTTSSNITVHRLVISYQKYIRYKYSFCKAKYAVIIFKIIQLWFHKQTDISTVRLKYIYQERDSINLPTGCSPGAFFWILNDQHWRNPSITPTSTISVLFWT